MKVRALGVSGSEMPYRRPPAFLLDGTILLDAGTIGQVLGDAGQRRIRRILLTHAHFDHIKGIPSFADNLIMRDEGVCVTIHGGREVVSALRKNIFNNRIWPDFSRIKSRGVSVLGFEPLSPSRPSTIDGYEVACARVAHTVPAYGIVVSDGTGKAIAYTGDTGPTDGAFWRLMARRDVRALIVEVSMPDRMEEMAILTGHLTPRLLEAEIRKMPRVPPRLFITHIKPQHDAEIRRGLAALGRRAIRILHDGMEIAV